VVADEEVVEVLEIIELLLVKAILKIRLISRAELSLI
jgi:hypothetical protein